MSNTAEKVGKDIGDLNDEDAGALGLRLGDLIPAPVTDLTLPSEGCLEHIKVLQVLFHDFDALKATRLPSLEQIVLHCEGNYDSETHPDPAYRPKCESLVLELEPTGVTLQAEKRPSRSLRGVARGREV
ncbi:F-box domain protein [Apiospora arundinis]|uniref:F-box domain protein n=1 Tax=Apiospora arundinis TaxID=335852 RepID=A0ABR2IVA6_9PEZI